MPNVVCAASLKTTPIRIDEAIPEPHSVVRQEIARQARLELIYSEALVPAERRVTLQAQDITVAAALTEVLLERGVDVVLLPTGQVGLVPKESTPKPTLPGTIVGTVTEAETGNPVANAQIAIDGRGPRLDRR